jgi:predicted DNA-binding transcriptional regulator AlpA
MTREVGRWRADLEGLVVGVAEAELPDLVGELARAQALARLRLSENGHAQAPARREPRPLDRYLDAAEISDRLSMSTDWVYRHADELGAVKLGGAVRFPERAVIRYLHKLR